MSFASVDILNTIKKLYIERKLIKDMSLKVYLFMNFKFIAQFPLNIQIHPYSHTYDSQYSESIRDNTTGISRMDTLLNDLDVQITFKDTSQRASKPQSLIITTTRVKSDLIGIQI